MTKLQGELGLRGFQAVGVTFNDEVNTPDQKANLAVTGKFINDFHVGFPVGIAKRDTVMSYLGLSVMDNGWGVPQIVVIDRKGNIVTQSDSRGESTKFLTKEDTLRTYLEGLLGPASSAAGSKSGASNSKAPAKTTAKKT
jgi:hypothetical protein